MNKRLKTLCTLFCASILLSGCAGEGITDTSEIASLARSAPSNTALVYWKNEKMAGSKNFFFEDASGHSVTLGAGEVVQLKLNSGENTFRVASIDILGKASSTDTIQISNDVPMTKYLILDVKVGLLTSDTSLEEVSKPTFLKIVGGAS